MPTPAVGGEGYIETQPSVYLIMKDKSPDKIIAGNKSIWCRGTGCCIYKKFIKNPFFLFINFLNYSQTFLIYLKARLKVDKSHLLTRNFFFFLLGWLSKISASWYMPVCHDFSNTFVETFNHDMAAFLVRTLCFL